MLSHKRAVMNVVKPCALFPFLFGVMPSVFIFYCGQTNYNQGWDLSYKGNVGP